MVLFASERSEGSSIRALKSRWDAISSVSLKSLFLSFIHAFISSFNACTLRTRLLKQVRRRLAYGSALSTEKSPPQCKSELQIASNRNADKIEKMEASIFCSSISLSLSFSLSLSLSVLDFPAGGDREISDSGKNSYACTAN